ncbi:hypothetical protein EV356DRAFT_511319 [Viridothelium virens]|uniref:Nudix hydrolase domain-containing protein n=1 Tax=Viridothelium virens TaxID=1048519 RepID=A0A6A6HQA7_VIRVR|nr:hypothetical protein EV356DRAFT_511319 [Viridothelium virens]
MTAVEKMELVDWLDDLCVRFIINLPQEELESVERICFQVEEAQWFYEDFIRPLDPSLPSMSLRNFCLRIFQHCPLLSAFSEYHHSAAFSEFLAYKTRVPVRGAIMLNSTMDHAVLVKGWKKAAAWSFPRGKINKDEKDLDCAIREVYEETGYDLREAGLVEGGEEANSIEITMREQHMKLFVFRGVPMDTHFEPRTRKEISRIDWYRLSDLPTFKKVKNQHQHRGDHAEDLKSSKFYMVAPFLVPLKKWIGHQRKKDALAERHNGQPMPKIPTFDAVVEDETAGETSTQEEDHVPATGGDIDRLLSSLRSSKQAQPTLSDNLPEVFDNPGLARDPVSELKRMLSVGSQLQPERPLMQAPSTLAHPLPAFPRNPAMSDAITSTNFPLQTPANQISEAPAEPRSPIYQHRPKEPLMQASQPPSFSTTGLFQPVLPTLPLDRSLQERLNALNNAVSQQNKMRTPAEASAGQGLRRDSLAFRPAQVTPPAPRPQAQPVMNPTPFQRTGNVSSSNWQQFGELQSPPAPAANKLPLPKLNNHTLGLLSTFKGNNAVPLVSPIEPSAPAFGRQAQNPPPEKSGSLNGALFATSGPSLNAPMNRIQNNQSPAMTISPPGTATNGYSSASPMPDTVRTPQQNTLLNLFRPPPAKKPSGPAPTSFNPQLAPSEPVELSAAPNTPKIERQPGQIQILQRPRPSETAEPKSPGHTKQTRAPHKPTHSHYPSGQISATVSGPLTTPDFSTLQKHESQASNSRPSTGKTTVRGGPAMAGSPKDVVSTGQLWKPESDSREQPVAAQSKQRTSQQPFQPRILQRPKPSQHAPASPTANSAASSFDRRDSLPQDQKNNLLSLFGKSATQSPVPSPQSPLASPLEKQQVSRHMSPAALSRSRFSSVTSVTSGPGNGAIAKPQSQVGSDSGRQTPVTPKDRDFLMGYLQGVVKGGK